MQHNKIINISAFIICFAASILAQGNSSAYDFPVKPDSLPADEESGDIIQNS